MGPGTLWVMAVTIDPKPRLRLPSGEFPEPKLARAHSWLPYAIVAWLLAVIVGHGIVYGWLPMFAVKSSTPPASVRELPRSVSIGVQASINSQRQSVPVTASTTPAPPARAVQPKEVDPSTLPACEAVTDPDRTEADPIDPLPVDLSRSPFGSLLDTRNWTRPCRGPHAVRVHLCVAVKAGQLLGATATTVPRDPGTERCIIRAASLVPLEPDAILRKVRINVDVPPDNAR